MHKQEQLRPLTVHERLITANAQFSNNTATTAVTITVTLSALGLLSWIATHGNSTDSLFNSRDAIRDYLGDDGGFDWNASDFMSLQFIPAALLTVVKSVATSDADNSAVESKFRKYWPAIFGVLWGLVIDLAIWTCFIYIDPHGGRIYESILNMTLIGGAVAITLIMPGKFALTPDANLHSVNERIKVVRDVRRTRREHREIHPRKRVRTGLSIRFIGTIVLTFCILLLVGIACAILSEAWSTIAAVGEFATIYGLTSISFFITGGIACLYATRSILSDEPVNRWSTCVGHLPGALFWTTQIILTYAFAANTPARPLPEISLSTQRVTTLAMMAILSLLYIHLSRVFFGNSTKWRGASLYYRDRQLNAELKALKKWRYNRRLLHTSSSRR